MLSLIHSVWSIESWWESESKTGKLWETNVFRWTGWESDGWTTTNCGVGGFGESISWKWRWAMLIVVKQLIQEESDCKLISNVVHCLHFAGNRHLENGCLLDYMLLASTDILDYTSDDVSKDVNFWNIIFLVFSFHEEFHPDTYTYKHQLSCVPEISSYCWRVTLFLYS